MSNKYPSNDALESLLRNSSSEELRQLSNIVCPGAPRAWSVTGLVAEIGKAGGSGIGNFFRGGRGIGYGEVVEDVLDALGLKGPALVDQKFEGKYHVSSLNEVSPPPAHQVWREIFEKDGLDLKEYTEVDLVEMRAAAGRYAEQCEVILLNHLLRETYEKMDEADRQRFNQELAKVASLFLSDKDPSGLAGVAGVMTIANFGGFATYTLMSSVLSAISFGSLGFGAYTVASSLLSIAIGPVGWLALGTVAAYKFGKPELNKSVPFVATVGMIRQRIKAGLPAPQSKQELPDSQAKPLTAPKEVPEPNTLPVAQAKPEINEAIGAEVVAPRSAEKWPVVTSTTMGLSWTSSEIDAIGGRPLNEMDELDLLDVADKIGDVLLSKGFKEALLNAHLLCAEPYRSALTQKFKHLYRAPKAHRDIGSVLLEIRRITEQEERIRLAEEIKRAMQSADFVGPPTPDPELFKDAATIKDAISCIRFFEARKNEPYRRSELLAELDHATCLPEVEEVAKELIAIMGDDMRRWGQCYQRMLSVLDDKQWGRE